MKINIVCVIFELQKNKGEKDGRKKRKEKSKEKENK